VRGQLWNCRCRTPLPLHRRPEMRAKLVEHPPWRIRPVKILQCRREPLKQRVGEKDAKEALGQRHPREALVLLLLLMLVLGMEGALADEGLGSGEGNPRPGDGWAAFGDDDSVGDANEGRRREGEVGDDGRDIDKVGVDAPQEGRAAEGHLVDRYT
jgi:hypothetical protein